MTKQPMTKAAAPSPLAADCTVKDFLDAFNAAKLDPTMALSDALEQLGFTPDSAPASTAAPAGSGVAQANKLTAEQLKICAEMKCEPSAFLAMKKAQRVTTLQQQGGALPAARGGSSGGGGYSRSR